MLPESNTRVQVEDLQTQHPLDFSDTACNLEGGSRPGWGSTRCLQYLGFCAPSSDDRHLDPLHRQPAGALPLMGSHGARTFRSTVGLPLREGQQRDSACSDSQQIRNPPGKARRVLLPSALLPVSSFPWGGGGWGKQRENLGPCAHLVLGAGHVPGVPGEAHMELDPPGLHGLPSQEGTQPHAAHCRLNRGTCCLPPETSCGTWFLLHWGTP